jgi:hypothetical protein
MEDIYSDWASLALESGRSQRLWERRGGRRRPPRERADQRRTEPVRQPHKQTGQTSMLTSQHLQQAGQLYCRQVSIYSRHVSLYSRQVNHYSRQVNLDSKLADIADRSTSSVNRSAYSLSRSA